MLNWITSACIEQAGQAGPLYVNTKISMPNTHLGGGLRFPLKLKKISISSRMLLQYFIIFTYF